MSTDNRKRGKQFQLWGWGLFIACAGFFIASSVATDNILSLTASIIFLVACTFFIIPLVNKGGRDEGD